MARLVLGWFVASSLLSCFTNHDQLVPDGFALHPDFSMVVVAAEPLVTDPVLMEFDHHGNAFVLQMPGYPFGDHPSSLLQLTDTDGDGEYDGRTLFADSLRTASTFMVYGDGILVAAAPDLLYLEDTDDDGKADLREVILSGFVDGNQQHNVNGLIYAMDNSIYLANGYNGGVVHWPDTPDETLPMSRYDLKIDLRNRSLSLLGRTSGGHEIALDDFGRIFHTHNVDYLQHLVFPDYYLPRGSVSPDHALDNIGQYEDNGLGRIYPLGEQEARLNHPEQAGYFSGSSGVFHYGGHAFPAEFKGDLFIADVVLNLIHRNTIESYGSSFRGRRVRKGVEFLASTDRAFRPVTINSGPDGAMYIMDMNRNVIEHPEWIPDPIEKDLDLRAGMDAGTIYKVYPRKSVAPAFTDFGGLVNDPMQYLDHPNQWVRMAAHQRVVLFATSNSVAHLKNSILRWSSDFQLLHGLWCLHGLAHVPSALLLEVFDKTSTPAILENILRISEDALVKERDPLLVEKVLEILDHDDARLRMQAVLTISRVSEQLDAEQRRKLVTSLLGRISTDFDPYLRLSIQCLDGQTLQLLTTSIFASTQTVEDGFLVSLLRRQFDASSPAEIRLFLDDISTGRYRAYALATAIRQFLEEDNSSIQNWKRTFYRPVSMLSSDPDLKSVAALARLRKLLDLEPTPEFQSNLKESRTIVLDPSATVSDRLAHFELLEIAGGSDKQLFEELLKPGAPPPLQSRALTLLKLLEPANGADILLDSWLALGPQARKQASDVLLFTPNYHRALLTAFESGQITLGEMNMHLERRRELLFSDDLNVRRRAELLFDDAGIVTRAESISEMQPALSLSGTYANGQDVYERLCAQCHIKGDLGVEVGPSLADVYHKSKATLMSEILDPNAGCETMYLSHTLLTDEGEEFTGIIHSESEENIGLTLIGGFRRSVPREQIQSLRSSGVSLMPEGLEQSMSAQEMADLLLFLTTP